MALVPQFGEPEPGRDYPDRPAAFGIAARGEKIALVEVTTPGKPLWRDLPGGGIDPGETPEQAMVREFGEEAGLVVAPGEVFLRADQFFINGDGQAFNVRGVFMTATLLSARASLKIEDDHQLIWRSPLEAMRIARREAHAWAICAWLRTLR
ncbi:MAG TPA: NUDIX domain-containing protein [Phenylobacterium sp.]|nr:NUDIX domain-containing protein [Phenylobacterium sp.]